MTEPTTRAVPSALPPTRAVIAAWRKLTRDQQIASYRAVLTAPDSERVGDATMADVLAAARQRAAARHG